MSRLNSETARTAFYVMGAVVLALFIALGAFLFAVIIDAANARSNYKDTCHDAGYRYWEQRKECVVYVTPGVKP